MVSNDPSRPIPGGAVAHQILVVEDEPETAASLKTLLEQNGYRVAIAKDGGQAQSTFVMFKPDFVILDLILPGESGFEICERMKQTNETIPVVMLSAIDLQEARVLADKVGADGYLTKPCEPAVLLDTIKAVAEEMWVRTHSGIPREERRIRFNCRCGKKFKVKPVHRGKTLTCPECGEPLLVPRHE
jgi:DNA-binding response OmpR family regulator